MKMKMIMQQVLADGMSRQALAPRLANSLNWSCRGVRPGNCRRARTRSHLASQEKVKHVHMLSSSAATWNCQPYPHAFQASSALCGSGTGDKLDGGQRRFLTFPQLPQILTGKGPSSDNGTKQSTLSSRIQRHSESRVLPYPPQHIQNVVASVSEYEKFVPWCSESRILRHYDENTFDAELAVGFKFFIERYLSRVVVVPGKSVTAVSKDTRLFRHLRTHWSFEKATGPSSRNPFCKVNFEVDFEFSSSIYTSASSHFMNEVVEEMVGAFERRCASTQTNIKGGASDIASLSLGQEIRDVFSESELNAVHAKFEQVIAGSGSREMTLSQFKTMYVSLFKHTAEESMEGFQLSSIDGALSNSEIDVESIAAVRIGNFMTRSITESDLEVVAERHFRVLDTNENGTLDILEFIAGMGTLFKGSMEQQWRYAFDLYDVKSDGYVTRQDLAAMFEATAQVQQKMLIELLKFTRDQLHAEGHHDIAGQFQIDIDMMDHIDEEQASAHKARGDAAITELVDEIFAEVDFDGDHRISFSEFCQSQILRSEIERMGNHKLSFFSKNLAEEVEEA